MNPMCSLTLREEHFQGNRANNAEEFAQDVTSIEIVMKEVQSKGK